MKLKIVGIRPENTWFVNRKIEISNYGNYLFLLVVSAYFVQYLVSIPDMLWVSYLGFSVSALVFFLFHKGKHVSARMLLSVMPNVLITFSHAYVVVKGESLLLQSMIFGVILILTPRMLFHYEERLPMYTSFILAFLIFLLIWPLAPILESSADTSSFKEGPGLILGWISPFTVLAGFVIFLQMESSAYDERNQQLLLEAENKAAMLKQKEEELNFAMAEVTAAMEEDKQRDWINHGVSTLSEIHQKFNGQEFYEKYLTRLVNYMECIQGALFIAEESNEALELKRVATYAVEDTSELILKPGEGLVGQSILDRSTLFLNQIPESYFVSSGLGLSKPKSLVVVPLIFDNIPQGALELASIQDFSFGSQKLIQRIAELLAAQLYNQKINSKMNLMLQEALHKSELLKTQEEEMRHALENMQSTQEEFEAKELAWKRERELLLQRVSK
jgi:hypothetical protein